MTASTWPDVAAPDSGEPEAAAPADEQADSGAVAAPDLLRLLDSLDDPVRLRRLLGQLARRAPNLALPGPEQLEADLSEALRLARGSVRRLGALADQRFRALELLVIERLDPVQAAQALHVSTRTLYRHRAAGAAEMARVLEEIWSQRPARRPPASGTPAEAIPQPRVFVGREADVQRALAALSETRLLVIGGPAGVGKTALGAALARHLAASRPVLWHRFRIGLSDSVPGLLVAAGTRLAELGATALATFLRESTSASAWEMLAQSLAAHGIEEHRLALLFDDADLISENQAVLGLLSSIHADAPSCQIALIARERLPFLRDAAYLELSGLDEDAVRAYLEHSSVRNLPVRTIHALFSLSGGNPQVLHLAAGAILLGQLDVSTLEERLLDVPDVRRFFFDQIYRTLTESEQAVLSAVSLVREPASATFLAGALESVSPSVPATLAELGRRFLLSANVEGLRLHTTVREFAQRMLTPARQAQLHRHIAAAYEREGGYEEACYHWMQAGDVAGARLAVLSIRITGQPEQQTRLNDLVRRLHAVGMEEDPEVAQFINTLGRRHR